jgi:hypothetical protein
MKMRKICVLAVILTLVICSAEAQNETAVSTATAAATPSVSVLQLQVRCCGEELIGDLGGKVFFSSSLLEEHVRQLLRSDNDKLTAGVYNLVVIRGNEFIEADRTNSNIRAEAEHRGYRTPPPEVAPLLWVVLSKADMTRLGFRELIVMHEPIPGGGGLPSLLGLFRLDGCGFPAAYFANPDGPWFDSHGPIGFVFLAPNSPK